MPNEIRLKVLNKVFVLAEGENVIGREAGCAVPLEGDLVSRRHAIISVSSGRAFLEDMGSANGTYLNDKRLVEKTELCDGDCVRIAFYRLMVENAVVDSEDTPTVKLLYCTQCGTALTDKMKFCVNCGEKLNEKLHPMTCSRCGAPLVEAVNYCMMCGLRVDQSARDNSDPSDQPQD